MILGEYDSDNDRYQIESGLTEDDYIAPCPPRAWTEGTPTTSNIADVPPEDPSGESGSAGGDRRGLWTAERHGRRRVDPGMGVHL